MARTADPRKYEVILEAAANLFLKHGYAAASIEAIANSAGVSKVTIYNRFETKERLFRKAVTRLCTQLQVELSWDRRATSLRDALMNFGQALNTFLDRPELVQFQRRLSADLKDHPEIGKVFLDAGPRHVHASLAELLTAAENDRRIATSGINDAAEQLVSMCRGLGDLERRFGLTPSKEETTRRVEAAVDMFLSVYGQNSLGSEYKPDEGTGSHG